MIRKWTVYTMALLWNLPFASVQGDYFSFRCQSGVFRWIDPPSTRRKKLTEAFTLSENIAHIVDHVPSSNTTLLLRPLIMNSLYDTVPSFLPQVACTFQNRSANIVWSSKRSGLISWRLGGPDISIQMKFFRGRMGVCGIGFIRCFLLSMANDKNYFP